MDQEPNNQLDSKNARRSVYIECITNIETLQRREYPFAPYRPVAWTILIAAIVSAAAGWLLNLDHIAAVVIFGSTSVAISLSLLTFSIFHGLEVIQLRLHAISLSAANFDKHSQ